MTQPPGEPPKALIGALRKLLRPLVRLMLAHGITLPSINGLLKEVLVDVAEKDFGLDGKAPSDSRVSLLTGVHRKDVRRLRNQPPADQDAPQAVSLGAQVVARWISEKPYIDSAGQPRTLRLRASRGASFERLVASVSRQDLRPRVVLDELIRLGIATTSGEDEVELLAEAFIPAAGFDEKAHYLGQNLRDHIAAAAANLDSEPAPWFERSVTYHGLSDDDVDALQAEAQKLAMDALKTINRRAGRMKQRNLQSSSASRRINFGSYFYAPPPVDDDER